MPASMYIQVYPPTHQPTQMQTLTQVLQGPPAQLEGGGEGDWPLLPAVKRLPAAHGQPQLVPRQQGLQLACRRGGQHRYTI